MELESYVSQKIEEKLGGFDYENIKKMFPDMDDLIRKMEDKMEEYEHE